jgi:hypothetical protein
MQAWYGMFSNRLRVWRMGLREKDSQCRSMCEREQGLAYRAEQCLRAISGMSSPALKYSTVPDRSRLEAGTRFEATVCQR